MENEIETGSGFADNFFAHYGKKGMKWGVRNDQGHEGEAVKTSKLDKLDKKWQKEIDSPKTYMKIYNSAADRMNNGEIDRINNKPEFLEAMEAGHFMDDNHPTTQKYFEEYDRTFNKVFNEEMVKLGSNPSGTKKFELREDGDGNPYAYLAPVREDAKHAETGDVDRVLKFVRNDKGLVTGLVDSEVELKHFGVKGMKWGVSRRERPATDVVVTQPRPGRKVKSSGGKNQPASEDAIKAEAARRKAKSSTTDALSNKELQELVTRMNLEQQYQRLAAPQQSAGKKFVTKFLGNLGIGVALQRTERFTDDKSPDFDPKMVQVVNALKKTTNQGNKKK